MTVFRTGEGAVEGARLDVPDSFSQSTSRFTIRSSARRANPVTAEELPRKGPPGRASHENLPGRAFGIRIRLCSERVSGLFRDPDLDISRHVRQPYGMPTIKISSKVEDRAWNDLKKLAAESHQNISGLLTEAIQDYVRRRRVRPVVLDHLRDSIRDNEELGRLLAE